MLLWTSSALEFRVILPVSSEGQFSPVLRLSGILTLHSSTYLRIWITVACPLWDMLFILRRNALSGQKSPGLILTQTQGFERSQNILGNATR